MNHEVLTNEDNPTTSSNVLLPNHGFRATHNHEDYVKFVTKLGSTYSMGDFNAKLGTAALGLTGETAEIATLILESHVAGGLDDEIKLKLVDEFSDLLWYAAFAAGNVVNVPFEPLCQLSSEVVFKDLSPICAVKFLEEELKFLVQATGGFADVAKKLMYHGKSYDEDYRQKLLDNLQFTVTYIAYLAKTVCNASIQDLIDHNVKKLSARYKSLVFTTEEFLAKEAAK